MDEDEADAVMESKSVNRVMNIDYRWNTGNDYGCLRAISLINDSLPAAVPSDVNANVQKTLHQGEECNALTCEHFIDEIKPTDSISNVYSKKKSSKKSTSSGSRSSRSCTSSARLQAEAEVYYPVNKCCI